MWLSVQILYDFGNWEFDNSIQQFMNPLFKHVLKYEFNGVGSITNAFWQKELLSLNNFNGGFIQFVSICVH